MIIEGENPKYVHMYVPVLVPLCPPQLLTTFMDAIRTVVLFVLDQQGSVVGQHILGSVRP